FRRNISCMEAWREFQELANVNKWPLFLFIHIRAFYWIGIVTAALAGGCLTCCVGFLPVVSHAILSPLLVFDRAYGLYVIESMGLEYQIVQPHAELDAVFDTEPAGTAQDTPVETVEDTHEPPDEHIS
ncbi:MAG: hypothetical protein QG656_656, partial [Candidatus Hydrogenedentes bacterium]|nr:hypothetical protein [Candidatus Hydrogenedentota bacterium]